jgi:DNA-binding LacI/PurR family transcriptional regulator
VPAGPPTLATVAIEAGVSRQTVSNALNNPDLLRPETLQRVQEVIDRLGYSPNRAARQLRTRSSHLIGLRLDLAPSMGVDGQTDRFVHSLAAACARIGHHVLLFTGDPSDPLDGYDDLLRSTAVDAFVVTDTFAGTPQAAFLKERTAPFVTFGRPWADPDADFCWVDVDGRAGCHDAAQHLRDMGHDQIAWLGWEAESRIGADRRSGWAQVQSDAGQDPDQWSHQASDNIDAARLETHHILDESSPTAICCVSDTVALGVLHALAERGMKPGVDLAVTGFDDSCAAQAVWPGLTSVRQPLEAVAETLAGLLQRVLMHSPVEKRGHLLAPTLVVRRSSAPGE